MASWEPQLQSSGAINLALWLRLSMMITLKFSALKLGVLTVKNIKMIESHFQLYSRFLILCL